MQLDRSNGDLKNQRREFSGSQIRSICQRIQVEDFVNQQDDQSDNEAMNLIKLTRKKIKSLDKQQRFKKAKQHLMDALNYRSPRPEINQMDSIVFRFIFAIQTSRVRDYFMFFFAYAFMYLIIIDDIAQTYALKLILQWSVLVIMWADVAFQIYHKSFETLRTISKHTPRFYLKILVLTLLVVDQILYTSLPSQPRMIRPFRILRATLPLFYDQFARKAIASLFSAWKDILVFLMFYTIAIFSFALIANQIVTLPYNTEYNQYQEDYGNYLKSIYLIYILSSYDSYPDNQLILVRQNLINYALFITFIILNLFFFTVIPAALIFNSFRDYRSKLLLIDQIKQQNSLLLCFVSLGQHDNLTIKMDKMLEFLLYVYKNKVRYIDCITYICLKLDDNGNNSIHMNEFLQICKILQSNAKMMPPTFNDFEPWIRFKHWLNNTIPIDQIAQGKVFKIIEIVIITLCFANSILIFTLHNKEVVQILDHVFIGLYILFWMIKIFGIGPEKYFDATGDQVDSILILSALILEIIPKDLYANNIDVLFKMARIYKILQLIEIFGLENNQIFRRFLQLMSQTVIIIPIFLKFAPMMLIFYYILGVIGMQVFYTTDPIDVNRSQYSSYQQFSNFKNFLGTQFFMIQVLTQAGWTMIAHNEADRFGYYGLVMLYFISCHVATVLVVASMLKGLVWETYNSINEQYKNRKIAELQIDQEQKAWQRKKQEIEQIKRELDKSDNLLKVPDTVLKKELYQIRIDTEILIKLKGIYSQNKFKQAFLQAPLNKKMFIHPSRTKLTPLKLYPMQTVDLAQSDPMQSDLNAVEADKLDIPQTIQNIFSKVKDEHNFKYPAYLQEQINKIIVSMVVSSNTRFSEVISYPKLFIQYLENRLVDPLKQKSKNPSSFSLGDNEIRNKKSLNLLTSQLNSMLDITKSQNQQKADIIQLMVEKQMFTEEQAKKIYFKKSDFETVANQRIDVNYVVRDTFLGPTNPKLISKFQTEYFADVYGKQFREINNLTLEPLLRYEATLTYCLRNILRYPNIEQIQFFTILGTIEDNISNRILKKGSLFKFVYQIDTLSDSWFAVQIKQNKDLKVHFIKSGIWVYHQKMMPSTIYHGEDIFNWNGIKGTRNFSKCSGYMKKLYQAFQSLAFCLLDEKKFFSGNPNSFVYDLYCVYKDVRKDEIKQNLHHHRDLKISKIMAVVLSKQQERQKKKKLPYQLSQLKRDQTVSKKNLEKFKFDQTQDKTFQKLKNLAVMDHQRIIQSQGLPYAFILNLLKQVQQILELNHQNLVDQVETVLNKEIEQAIAQKNSPSVRDKQPNIFGHLLTESLSPKGGGQLLSDN